MKKLSLQLFQCLLLFLGICSQKCIANEAKIYDCFLFFNELEILDIRLHELNDAVDYFVLVESCETFRGQPKPYYFEENKARFAAFLSKIIHVKVDKPVKTDSPWIREAVQRNYISKGLKKCKWNDIIFISDVDEIFRKELIPYVIDYYSSVPYSVPILGFKMPMYIYYLNRPFEPAWIGTMAAPYYYLKSNTPQTLRDWSHHTHIHPGKCQYLTDAGWHFSYLGGVEAYIKKWRAFSHGDDRVLQEEEVRKLLNEGPFVPFDDSFPDYIKNNEAHFRDIGFIHE